jgi:hypothetical protein
MTEQDKMRAEQLRKQTRERHSSVSALWEMREIKLSETQEANLRHHEWLQYHTTEDLQDCEVVFVKGVGKCTVRAITENLVELWIVQGK